MAVDLESFRKELQTFVTDAGAKLTGLSSLEKAEELRVEWLGKKGALTAFSRRLGEMTDDMRPAAGAAMNEYRTQLVGQLDAAVAKLKTAALAEKLKADKIDTSLPGRKPSMCAEHPVRITEAELIKIFESCGFVTEVGPELEHEFYNFDALNMPANHPARALQDTFYVANRDGAVLRTHTSPVQIRVLLAQKPPVRIIAPGRVYRADYDATHSPMFHQIEGLLVDKDVNMGHLVGILSVMVTEFFGRKLEVRLRPSFFPFTEPSAEIDIQCVFCLGKGCKTCKQSGWVEIGGCGMVDPEVFKAVDLDPDSWRGFAFGMGIERMTMLKYGVDDLRTLFESDRKFIAEFSRWRP